MTRTRKKRKAKATKEIGGHLVEFRPGGFYHLVNSELLTGVHRRLASDAMHIKLLPLARRAAASLGEWVY